MPTKNNIHYNLLMVPELKALCRERDLRGYTRMRKNELIACLNNSDVINQGRAIQAVTSGKRTDGVQTERRRSDHWVNRRKEKKIEKHARKRLKERRRKEENKKREEKRRKNRERRIRKERRREERRREVTYEFRETDSCLRGFAKQYTIEGREGVDADTFLDTVRPLVIDLLMKNTQKKVRFILQCEMEHDDMNTGEVITTWPHPYFHSKNEVILAATDLEEVYDNAVERIKEEMANFQKKGSGWRFKSVIRLDIHTTVYEPLRGNSYIPLPKKLKNKKAIINPQNNEDEECFKWCITRALNYQDGQKNLIRITQYLRRQAEQLNWRNINFPVSLRDICTFEKNNDGIRVNVFGYEDWGSKIYPCLLYTSPSPRDRQKSRMPSSA